MIAAYPNPFAPWYDGYGTLALTATDTAPVEPIALADVKTFLRVEFTNDDFLIASLITAARRAAEIAQRRVLVTTQYDLSFDYWPALRIQLATPVASVDLVQYTDLDGNKTELAAETDYLADLSKQPSVISAPWNTTWPWFSPQPSSSILIRFTAGYAATDPFWFSTGAQLKTGMLLLISHWYTNRLPAGQNVAEYPYSVTHLLNSGSLRRPR